MAECPSDTDIKQIFKRLHSTPTNKQCFDCNSNNPSWASVTYGVFLCIDCSAVHRSLGVHLTFIRSTELDTKWTWLQLRAMQVGGNANAKAFFNQHGTETPDAQKKYNSRAAAMYRDKLVSLAQHAMRLHGSKVFIDAHHEPSTPEIKEVDFFSEHGKENNFNSACEDNMRMGAVPETRPAVATATAPVATNGRVVEDPTAGPNVDLALSTSPTQVAAMPEPKRAFIGAKKAPAGKKGKGLGAQRVKKDFGEIESRALQVDKEREELAKNVAVQESKTKEEQDKQMANMRLAYQDMSVQRKKEEARLTKTDPKKAEQFERLGMGFAGNKGISHSAISDMQTIQQEAPSSKGRDSSRRDFDSYGEKPRGKKDFFDDEFEFVSSNKSSWNRGDDDFGSGGGGSGWGSKNRGGAWDFDDKPKDNFQRTSYDNNDIDDEDEEEVIFDEYGLKPAERHADAGSPTTARKTPAPSSASSGAGDAAQKKFGKAKAISSDQYFGNDAKPDYETKQNLSRLEGSTSISSDDFFNGGNSGGGGSRRTQSSYSANSPDMQDIKDGVKQGVTKVAGKMSSLANGLMNSLQDRYG